MKKDRSSDEVARRGADAALLQENEALAQQVKRLVRAEGKLYQYQQELDEQLKEYQELYELNRRLIVSFDLAGLYAETVSFVVRNLEYERALVLQRSEQSASYRASALDGYYDPSEQESMAQFSVAMDAPFLAALGAGREYLIFPEPAATGEPGGAELEQLALRLLMDEFFIYPLGYYALPHALLVLGNSAANAEFHRRVGRSYRNLLSLGNLVGLISSLVENRVYYRKMEQALEALRDSEQRYRQLSEALEQRVREAVDELRQKDKLLMIQSRQAVMGEMLSNIAHQWRQPLTMLGLLAQHLQMTQQKEGLSAEFIENNVTRTLEIIHLMSKTIDDFRYFFRPDTEKVQFRAGETIEKTLSLLEGSFKVHGIRTELSRGGDPLIVGYPSEFTQVLLNILINARDALAAAKVAKPLIRVALYSQGKRTVISIADNAGGVPAEIENKIFEPYFTTKGPEQGTGIGLFMCKTIIEKNMNGRLTVRNTADGAEFRIEV